VPEEDATVAEFCPEAEDPQAVQVRASAMAMQRAACLFILLIMKLTAS
jgi:hypothetical protein